MLKERYVVRWAAMKARDERIASLEEAIVVFEVREDPIG